MPEVATAPAPVKRGPGRPRKNPEAADSKVQPVLAPIGDPNPATVVSITQATAALKAAASRGFSDTNDYYEAEESHVHPALLKIKEIDGYEVSYHRVTPHDLANRNWWSGGFAKGHVILVAKAKEVFSHLPDEIFDVNGIYTVGGGLIVAVKNAWLKVRREQDKEPLRANIKSIDYEPYRKSDQAANGQMVAGRADGGLVLNQQVVGAAPSIDSPDYGTLMEKAAAAR